MRLFLGVSLTVEVGQPLPLMLSEQSRGLVCVCAAAERVSHGGRKSGRNTWEADLRGVRGASPLLYHT